MAERDSHGPGGLRAIGDLAPEEKQAGAAALGLIVALFLPWYEKNVAQGGTLVSGNLNAFGVVSFVEAAIMLVAVGVLALLWARAQRRGFHLPGGDGTVIMGAGAWAAFLLVWRLFDKPDVDGTAATVGITWGWFVAVVMAALLAAAGIRMRAAHRPEPPNPAEEELWAPPRRRRADRRDRQPVDPNALTRVLKDRPPAWEGDPPEPPGRARRPDEPPPLPPAATEAKTEPLFEPPPDRLF